MHTVHMISLLLQCATFLQGKSTALPAPQVGDPWLAASESNCGVLQGAVNSNHLSRNRTYPGTDSIYPNKRSSEHRSQQLPPGAIYCRQRSFADN
ncbi:uncharacterized protein P174DRAFT_191105 [Aspergillus novofumigatus IBT 16806]|uniref:Secreted protein n=1 Tax=Aspergillus novofumigatus (strain IBT 16806) TaxID=1392255 RepID=A0A2I1CAM0_ASPN1|nr:uncharacterized protein P174DRAFT_191105 [Aspergillus novofumigatus IBT 16806]PKX94673.1 hypothetical protein P174DRAFT_191105 [Aspergillus novofumigatus IBT 16806]